MKLSVLNQSGVYKIQHIQNGKLYIGSAVNIRKRWKSHRSALRRNKHHNNHLASAMKKYGVSAFAWEVVEFCPVTILTEREQFWLDYYQSFKPENGYNNSPTASSPLGVRHSAASRENMRLAHLGIKRSQDANEKIRRSQWKQVFQFSLDGTLLDVFSSILEAEKRTGVSRQLISMNCRGITKSAKSFYWSFENRFVQPHKCSFTQAPWKRKSIKNQSGQIWTSIQEASIDLRLTRSQIYHRIKKGELFYV